MTKERDRLLDDVRETVRAEDRDGLADPRWDELARGELADEERAALEALAAADPACAGAPALFTPFDEATRQRFLEAARAGLGTETAKVAVPEVAAPEKATAKVVSLGERRVGRRAFVGVSAALALAAGAALWWRTRTPREQLPAYALLASGGVRHVRADSAAPLLLLAPGARVMLRMRPQTRVPGVVTVRAFLVQGSREVALESDQTFVAGDGAVQMSGRVPKDAALAPGRVEIVVALGRPEALGEGPVSIGELSARGDLLRWARVDAEMVGR